ncbi:MAG: thioredoxin family protein [Candidatus Bathyarchaeota archaeon]|nr:thioredoxin family protein [Candidatus Bathyarchaeota archaeon]MDH5787534.1 thioredoxin family protein [Candidatus Bathyarchaeota archaeon]
MGVFEVDISNWEKEVSQSDILTVVYFWHERCPWCMRLSPIFDSVAEGYSGKIRFAKLNILENQANQETATNLGVMSTPTMMFFCSGRAVGQVVGFMSEDDLRKTLDEMLGRYRTCLKQSTDLRSYIV